MLYWIRAIPFLAPTNIIQATIGNTFPILPVHKLWGVNTMLHQSALKVMVSF